MTVKSYLKHYVCVDCRIHFKYESERECPKCKQMMKNFGRKFKPPKKNDKNQWKKIKLWLVSPCEVPLWNIDTYSEAKIVHKDTLKKFSDDEITRHLFKHNGKSGCYCGR